MFKVGVGESDVAAFNRHGADFQTAVQHLRDRGGPVAAQAANHRPLVGHGKDAVDIGAPGPVGVELVGAGFQNAPQQFLLSSSSLFAGQRDHVLEDRIFGNVRNLVGNLDNIAVLLEGHGHIFVLNLVTARSHALSQRRGGGGKRDRAAELSRFRPILRDGLDLAELVEDQDGLGMGQHLFDGPVRGALGNVAIRGCSHWVKLLLRSASRR